MSTQLYTTTKSVSDKSPFEIRSGKKSNLNHLRIFSFSKILMHITKRKREIFDAKSKKCVMVGYSSFVSKTREIIVSRNVVFLESEAGSLYLEENFTIPFPEICPTLLMSKMFHRLMTDYKNHLNQLRVLLLKVQKFSSMSNVKII